MNEDIPQDRTPQWLGRIDALIAEIEKAPGAAMMYGGGDMQARQAIWRLTEARFWLEARQREIAEMVAREAQRR